MAKTVFDKDISLQEMKALISADSRDKKFIQFFSEDSDKNLTTLFKEQDFKLAILKAVEKEVLFETVGSYSDYHAMIQSSKSPLYTRNILWMNYLSDKEFIDLVESIFLIEHSPESTTSILQDQIESRCKTCWTKTCQSTLDVKSELDTIDLIVKDIALKKNRQDLPNYILSIYLHRVRHDYGFNSVLLRTTDREIVRAMDFLSISAIDSFLTVKLREHFKDTLTPTKNTQIQNIDDAIKTCTSLLSESVKNQQREKTTQERMKSFSELTIKINLLDRDNQLKAMDQTIHSSLSTLDILHFDVDQDKKTITVFFNEKNEYTDTKHITINGIEFSLEFKQAQEKTKTEYRAARLDASEKNNLLAAINKKLSELTPRDCTTLTIEEMSIPQFNDILNEINKNQPELSKTLDYISQFKQNEDTHLSLSLLTRSTSTFGSIASCQLYPQIDRILESVHSYTMNYIVEQRVIRSLKEMGITDSLNSLDILTTYTTTKLNNIDPTKEKRRYALLNNNFALMNDILKQDHPDQMREKILENWLSYITNIDLLKDELILYGVLTGQTGGLAYLLQNITDFWAAPTVFKQLLTPAHNDSQLRSGLLAQSSKGVFFSQSQWSQIYFSIQQFLEKLGRHFELGDWSNKETVAQNLQTIFDIFTKSLKGESSDLIFSKAYQTFIQYIDSNDQRSKENFNDAVNRSYFTAAMGFLTSDLRSAITTHLNSNYNWNIEESKDDSGTIRAHDWLTAAKETINLELSKFYSDVQVIIKNLDRKDDFNPETQDELRDQLAQCQQTIQEFYFKQLSSHFDGVLGIKEAYEHTIAILIGMQDRIRTAQNLWRIWWTKDKTEFSDRLANLKEILDKVTFKSNRHKPQILKNKTIKNPEVFNPAKMGLGYQALTLREKSTERDEVFEQHKIETAQMHNQLFEKITKLREKNKQLKEKNKQLKSNEKQAKQTLADTRKLCNHEKEDLKKEYEQIIKDLKEEHKQNIDVLKQKHREELDKLNPSNIEEHKKNIQDLKQKHREELDKSNPSNIMEKSKKLTLYGTKEADDENTVKNPKLGNEKTTQGVKNG